MARGKEDKYKSVSETIDLMVDAKTNFFAHFEAISQYVFLGAKSTQ